jgi:hypothetical protein
MNPELFVEEQYIATLDFLKKSPQKVCKKQLGLFKKKSAKSLQKAAWTF